MRSKRLEAYRGLKATLVNSPVSTPENVAMIDQAIAEELEAIDLREHAMDFIHSYDSDTIAQMVRERILTIADVDAALHRKVKHDV